jgi:UDP-galactopyranose mutase
MKRILIVGAGFSGAVVARKFAESGLRCLVIDERDHVAGNCHTSRDEGTGVMVHRYGPHIFNANNEEVWTFVNRFCEMRSYINRVKASTSRGIFSMPINLHTINQFFGKRFNPAEARAFIATLGDTSIKEPANFEEQALKFLGHDLYKAFFYGYTRKQWGCEPTELPASILKRLPVRFNYDDSYYNKKYQAIPVDGYSALIENMLRHDNIEVKLSTRFVPGEDGEFLHTIYTGPIDSFFAFSEGHLGYRTVFWSREEGEGDVQGNAVINYPEMDVNFTRRHEHKHFAPWETHARSLVFTEFSKETEDGDIPYYPKRLSADKGILASYLRKAQEQRNVSFLGRLATYRYMDMDMVIEEALGFSTEFLSSRSRGERVPVFPKDPAQLA